jgi:hypothetical protein
MGQPCTGPPPRPAPEGTVCKRRAAAYRPGRSRFWVKVKHSTTGTFDVQGWRPATASHPAELLLADGDDWVGTAILAIPPAERAPFVEFVQRYGHPSGPDLFRLPHGCLSAAVRYTSRTPTRRQLREAVVTSIAPANGEPCGVSWHGCLRPSRLPAQADDT